MFSFSSVGLNAFVFHVKEPFRIKMQDIKVELFVLQ